VQAAGTPVALAKADATLAGNKALSERFGVKGYPTLKIFRGHSAEKGTEYQGPREADGIVSYLTKQAGPASAKLSAKADVDALLAKEDVVVVRA
jgi:protein disulfide-isomerase A1